MEWGKRGLIGTASIFLLLSGCGGSDRDSQAGSSNTETTAVDSTDLSNLKLTDLNQLSFSSGKGSIQIAQKPNATYILTLSSTNTTPGAYAVQVSDESVPSSATLFQALESDETVDPETELFHQYLMESGVALSESEVPLETTESSLSALKTAKAGEKQTFKVLSSMTSITQYAEVEAELRVVTDNLYFYVDSSVKDQVKDEEIQKLADIFEETIIPTERPIFGSESDINGDTHTTILLSCTTNGMATSGGIVTGFFFPGDLYANSGSNPASNEMEIFYTLVPDPKGKCGVPISNDFAFDNILPGVLAHEYQHMISFNKHVILEGGSVEAPWLNEALSHLAEDWTGLGKENPSRVKLFLDHPDQAALIPSTSPRLAERGGSYLFIRYLCEQHPDCPQFLKNLTTGKETSVDNVVKAFGGQDSSFDEFSEFLNQWSIALLLSNTGATTDSRYNYKERQKHANTDYYTGICLRCDPEDGRKTILAGPALTYLNSAAVTANLYASSTQFYRISSNAEAVTINASGGPNLAGSLIQLEP